MDKIKIENLEIFGNHGVFQEENALGQKFLVSAILYTDIREAGMTDDLTKSIHYGEACHFITKFLTSHTYQLIEAAAEQTARGLLLEYDRLQAVELEIKKPWAPIGLPLETVSVCIERGWHTAYIALGSNMGNRREYLEQAVAALEQKTECRVIQKSDWIETKPYGVTDQADFLNGALECRTLLTPMELLDFLHELEAAADRKRELRWGPRTLDLDILLYDEEIMHLPELTIPHIDMCNRNFVLQPLAQIAGGVRHPVSGKTISMLLEDLNS